MEKKLVDNIENDNITEILSNRKRIKDGENLMIISYKSGIHQIKFQADLDKKSETELSLKSAGFEYQMADIDSIKPLEIITEQSLYNEIRKVSAMLNICGSLDNLPDLEKYLEEEYSKFNNNRLADEILDFGDTIQAAIDILENVKEKSLMMFNLISYTV